jgi:predicted HNH restriction endonuclease
MVMTTAYQQYLKSVHWQKKRQECFAYHGKRCKACKTASGPIQVHHLDYSRIGKESAAFDLIPLCVPCHREVTYLYRRNRRRGLRRVTMEFLQSKK